MSCKKVGIDDIAVHVPKLYLDTSDLEKYRGYEEGKISKGIGISKMAVADSYEDSCTLPAMAIKRLIDKNDINPGDIGRIYIGSETRVDHSKPNAAYVLGMLEKIYGEDSFCHCGAVDFTFACIGGTYALLDTVDWIRAGSNRGKVGIVATADISKYDLKSSGEYTQGAGSVAMLIKENPRLISFDEEIGIYTKDDRDFFRPLHRKTPVFDGKYSNNCYLNAMKNALANYEKQFIKKMELKEGEVFFDKIDYMLFHIPYPKMAEYAASFLIRRCRRGTKAWEEIENQIGKEPRRENFERDEDYLKEDEIFRKKFRETDMFKKEFNAKIKPGLFISKEVGNIYTGSLYLGLYSLVLNEDNLPGKKVGLGSYGSGSSAIVFSGTIQEGVEEVKKNMKLKERLDSRKRISVKEYEELHEGQNKFFEGIGYPERAFISTPEKEFALTEIGKEGVFEGYRYYKWID